MTNPTQSTGGVPVVAHEIRTYGRTNQFVVRADVADEFAGKLRSQGFEHVQVREVVYLSDHLTALASVRESEERLAAALKAHVAAHAVPSTACIRQRAAYEAAQEALAAHEAKSGRVG